MWSSVLQFIKDYQPVSVTGFFAHSFRWPFSWTLPYKNPNFKPRTPLDKGIDIYCVHGIADRSSAFEIMLKHMVQKNTLPDFISMVHLVPFDRRRVDIPNYAKQLQAQILENAKKKVDVDKRVILFGHSRGGLVSAYFTEYLAKQAGIHVHGAFTFGAPFGGADAAAFAFADYFAPSVPEMKKNSELLKELQPKMLLSKVPYKPYAAELDMLVSKESASIKGRSEAKVMKRHGHVSLLSSGKMLDDMKPLLASMYNDPELSESTENINDADVIKQLIHEYDLYQDSAPDFLEMVCEEIDAEMKNLKDASKTAVLAKLRTMLAEILSDHKNPYYPAATTIGEFISAYLEDEGENGRKPVDILKVPVSAYYFFAGVNTTLNFVMGLIEKYKDVPLTVDNMTHTRFNGMMAEVCERVTSNPV